MGNRCVDLGRFCGFVAGFCEGFFKSISYIIVSDRVFTKPLTVFCPLLPTEPQLLNNKPCILKPGLGSVEEGAACRTHNNIILIYLPPPPSAV